MQLSVRKGPRNGYTIRSGAPVVFRHTLLFAHAFVGTCTPTSYPDGVLTVSVFLLASGAAARITRFLTRDYLTRHLRAWALARWDEDHDVPYLLRCGWCMSVWVFAAVFSVAYFYGDTFLFPWIAGALTGSYLYGLVSSVFDEPDEEPARE